MSIKNVIYTNILESCKYANNDMYWENIFENLAYGKPPYGTFISKDFLCCNVKRKEFMYKLENNDPKKLYNDIYKLLSDNLGIMSPIERLHTKHAYDEDEQDNSNGWNSIRKKNMKDLLIEMYVSNMKKQFNLNNTSSVKLLYMIYFAILFRLITVDDIEYKHNKITKIRGIDFIKGKLVFDIDMSKLSDTSTISTLPEKTLMSDNWEKYLKGIV